jgi:hypothetical protein
MPSEEVADIALLALCPSLGAIAVGDHLPRRLRGGSSSHQLSPRTFSCIEREDESRSLLRSLYSSEECGRDGCLLE